MPWNIIGHCRSTLKYFRGACLYGSAIDRIYLNLGRIPMYRNLYMIIIFVFTMVVDLSLYVIYLHTLIRRLCHIILHVRVIYAICLDHLQEMLLSALNSSFIFPSSIFIHPSAFWDFCVPYLLIGTFYPDLVGIYSSPFNICKGVYYHKYPFQLNPTQYQYHLDGFSDTTSNCSTS